MSLNTLIVYGSVRTTRQGIKAARFVTNQCTARGHTALLVDPLEENLPLLDRMFKEYAAGEAPPRLAELATRVKEADALIVVSGEYNHSIPPALSNVLCHFLEEYFWKPSGIVCYSAGAFGGVRAAMQLRAMLGELGTPSVPTILPIPRVQDSFDDADNPRDPTLLQRTSRFLEELEWYARALHEARKAGVPY